jgi:DnaJ-class molecular chaperone
MNGRLEWPDPTPDGPTPEEEALMDSECKRCNGSGRVEVFGCECGLCPDLEDCPRCGGSGFDTPGTGYNNVCGECGGLRQVPRREEPEIKF